MDKGLAAPANIAAYISNFSPEVRAVLERIRRTVRTAVPQAEEIISYRMPAFRLNGIVLYFAAFKDHIGIYPPVSGDRKLEKDLAPYRGPKGNLKFPLGSPFPYELVSRIAKLRAKQLGANAAGKRATPAAKRTSEGVSRRGARRGASAPPRRATRSAQS